MPRDHWDCWDDVETPPTTSMPPTSTPPPSSGPEPEEPCYPPRIEELNIGRACHIEIFITKG